MKGTWDKGIDFETIMKKLVRDLKKTRNCNIVIAIIQLRNGSRISETIKAYQEFLKKKQLIVQVEVSKKKSKEYRKIVIPDFLLEYHKICKKDLEKPYKTIYERYRKYLARRYRINTHSLRYSFITYLIEQGISESIIAKITHHSTLNYVLRYTQQKKADQILINL